MEKTKRLTPKKNILRDLYLKSGNQCAFPGCVKTLLNDKGNLVGQVCHIEAAMPGGERFNVKQTNEERREYDNLILLCHDHHIETNDETEYTVKRLKKIKKKHEEKYGDVATKLYNSISDITLQQSYEYCTSLKKINKVLEWGLETKDLKVDIVLMNKLVDTLKKLPPDTREIFTIMVSRVEGSEINLEEVKKVTYLSNSDMRTHINILEKYNFISEPELNEYFNNVCEFQQYDQFDVWGSIKEFSDRTSISLDEIINGMNFNLLD